jgi:hypothetical protein
MLGASRRALLVAALGFGCCRGVRAGSGLDPTLEIFRTWLSGWRGVGLIAAGMARQGYDLSLTRYAERGWRATFYVSGREHSPTGAAASAFEATPFGAVQVAAWETLARA